MTSVPHFQHLRGHPDENKHANIGVKWRHRSNLPYGYLQNNHFQQPKKVCLKYIRTEKNLNKYRKIKINPCILPDNNGINLETTSKGIIRKYTHSWRLNNTPLVANGSLQKSIRKLSLPGDQPSAA